jgi:hypothetical protein
MEKTYQQLQPQIQAKPVIMPKRFLHKVTLDPRRVNVNLEESRRMPKVAMIPSLTLGPHFFAISHAESAEKGFVSV